MLRRTRRALHGNGQRDNVSATHIHLLVPCITCRLYPQIQAGCKQHNEGETEPYSFTRKRTNTSNRNRDNHFLVRACREASASAHCRQTNERSRHILLSFAHVYVPCALATNTETTTSQ